VLLVWWYVCGLLWSVGGGVWWFWWIVVCSGSFVLVVLDRGLDWVCVGWGVCVVLCVCVCVWCVCVCVVCWYMCVCISGAANTGPPGAGAPMKICRLTLLAGRDLIYHVQFFTPTSLHLDALQELMCLFKLLSRN